MSRMIERQVITTWYKPEEKTPDEGMIVVASVSGKCRNITLDHALVTAEFCKDEGWYVEPFDFTLKGAWLKVHAWADLEPYWGE